MNKAYILIIIVLLLLISCNDIVAEKKQVKEEKSPTSDVMESLKVGDFEILIFDSCEYIIYKKSANRNIGFGFMAHKGNCKNNIHQY